MAILSKNLKKGITDSQLTKAGVILLKEDKWVPRVKEPWHNSFNAPRIYMNSHLIPIKYG